MRLPPLWWLNHSATVISSGTGTNIHHVQCAVPPLSWVTADKHASGTKERREGKMTNHLLNYQRKPVLVHRTGCLCPGTCSGGCRVAAVRRATPLQGTAEPLSQDGGTSGKTYLRKGKTTRD